MENGREAKKRHRGYLLERIRWFWSTFWPPPCERPSSNPTKRAYQMGSASQSNNMAMHAHGPLAGQAPDPIFPHNLEPSPHFFKRAF